MLLYERGGAGPCALNSDQGQDCAPASAWKTKAGLPFQAGVPEKVGIDGALHGGEMQARGQEVLELVADEFSVGLFGFHGWGS